MDNLHKDPILEFPSDLLQVVRKEYDLVKPGEMDRAIDILELWLKKQDHFLKRDFSRSYLERSIIRAKGSVERTKERLDKLCTARSLLPQIYTIQNVKKFDHLYDRVYDVICPKVTSDYYRVYLIHIHNSEDISAQLFTEYYIRGFYMMEYFSAYDYANGVVVIFDYRKLNILEFLKNVDLMEVARVLNVAFNGYGLRIKQIHVISTSKVINLLVSTFKQLVSEKLGNRILVHSDIESVYKYVDKSILPEECGGTEMSIKKIHNKWNEVLSSDEFMSYIKELYEAKINETLRPLKSQDDGAMGLAGTFRSLSVD